MNENSQLDYVKEQIKYEIGLYTQRKHFNFCTKGEPEVQILFPDQSSQ
jgi:hypothetical protein